MKRRDLFKILPGAGVAAAVAAAALPGVAEAKPVVPGMGLPSYKFTTAAKATARFDAYKCRAIDLPCEVAEHRVAEHRLVLLDIGVRTFDMLPNGWVDTTWNEGKFTRIWDTSEDGLPTKWMAGLAKTAWAEGKAVRLTAPYLLTMGCYEAEAFEVDLIWERCREIGLVDPNGRVPVILGLVRRANPGNAKLGDRT